MSNTHEITTLIERFYNCEKITMSGLIVILAKFNLKAKQ